MSDLAQDPNSSILVAHVRRLANGADGRIVCHAEGEDGVMSALILFARQGQVHLRFPDRSLTDALFAGWNESAKAGAPWAAMTLIVDGPRAEISRQSPAEYAPPEIENRIPLLVKRHFGASDWVDDDAESKALRRPWWRLW